MYTAVPAKATAAPAIHIRNDTPTLPPAELRITEGVANIPVPITRLKMRKIALTMPVTMIEHQDYDWQSKDKNRDGPSCRLARGTLSKSSPLNTAEVVSLSSSHDMG